MEVTTLQLCTSRQLSSAGSGPLVAPHPKPSPNAANSIRCAAPRFCHQSPFCPIAYSASSSHVPYLISSYGLAFKAAKLHFYFQVPKIQAS
ncbi:hypothetical protein M441DRAFT_348388 [Trichoderma asperellum CBS 433.97]|uniref:Uncharacterized protein n=1 Tax=Trichoderma asperellum (strain ATCC 204424 / CBS 433.97 / NBRC 101777) TaxID=1042311 RepID=A0A2T3ZHX3_TRIA4|nr:hypothetical protein M441DRAFT_348388 [Trichoderma asperellum CBS 433.97]PTB44414.1 hypothetical protein M441DRAFT_348388 [Trichoderma asperellum CBS 433.97]